LKNPELQRPLFYDSHRKSNLFVRNDLRKRLEVQGITGLRFFDLQEYREGIIVQDTLPRTKKERTKQQKRPQWSDPAHRELSEWLADPAEYGEPPVAIETIHQERTRWPFFEEEGEIEIAFHRYRMASGESGIAMTGPIIWSFSNTDLEGLNSDELKRLFAGWYIVLMAVNSPNFNRETNEAEQQALAQSLSTTVTGFLDLIDYIHVGELMWYAYRQEFEGTEQVLITNTIEQMILTRDSPYLRLPSLYYFLGSLFFEGKLE
jgi:hypothetical protein